MWLQEKCSFTLNWTCWLYWHIFWSQFVDNFFNPQLTKISYYRNEWMRLSQQNVCIIKFLTDWGKIIWHEQSIINGNFLHHTYIQADRLITKNLCVEGTRPLGSRNYRNKVLPCRNTNVCLTSTLITGAGVLESTVAKQVDIVFGNFPASISQLIFIFIIKELPWRQGC